MSSFVNLGLRVREIRQAKKTVESAETRVLYDTRVADLKSRYYSISEVEHSRIVNLEQHHDDEEQTATEEWLESRKNRVTGSRMGAIGHCNKFCSADQCLKDLIWNVPMDEKGVDNCKWGNLSEPRAEEAFVGYMSTFLDERNPETGLTLVNFSVENLGLFVCKKEGHAMLAMSPDGIMYSTWKDDQGNEVRKISLVEYKCPVPSPIAYDRGYSEAEDDVELEKTARLFGGLPDSFDYFKKKWFHVQRRSWRNKCKQPGLYKANLLPERLIKTQREKFGEFPRSDWVHQRKKLPVPPYYMAQCQYGMEIFGLSGMEMNECYFVVHTPVRTAVTVFPRDRSYGKWLVETAKQFWEERYVKNAALKMSGQLKEGEIV